MELLLTILKVIGILMLMGATTYGFIGTLYFYMSSHDDPGKWLRFAGSWHGMVAIIGSLILVALVPWIGLGLAVLLVFVDDILACWVPKETDE